MPGDVATGTDFSTSPEPSNPVAAGRCHDAQLAPPRGPGGQGQPVCPLTACPFPGRHPRHPGLPPVLQGSLGSEAAWRAAGALEAPDPQTSGPRAAPWSPAPARGASGDAGRAGQGRAGRPPRPRPRPPFHSLGDASPTVIPSPFLPKPPRPLPRPRCRPRPLHLPESLRPSRSARGLGGPEERRVCRPVARPRSARRPAPLQRGARAHRRRLPRSPALGLLGPPRGLPGVAVRSPPVPGVGCGPEPQLPGDLAAALTQAAAEGDATGGRDGGSRSPAPHSAALGRPASPGQMRGRARARLCAAAKTGSICVG